MAHALHETGDGGRDRRLTHRLVPVAERPIAISGTWGVACLDQRSYLGMSGEVRQLSNATATDAVDTFLRRAGGASPDGAFRMLTDESQRSHAGFVTAWGPVLFADRVGDLAKVKGLNTYEVTYATYDGGGEPIAPARGKVASHVQTVQVLGPIEEPRIRLAGEASRGTALNDEVEFMKTFPTRRMQTFNSTEGRSVASPKVMPTNRSASSASQQSFLMVVAHGLGWCATRIYARARASRRRHAVRCTQRFIAYAPAGVRRPRRGTRRSPAGPSRRRRPGPSGCPGP